MRPLLPPCLSLLCLACGGGVARTAVRYAEAETGPPSELLTALHRFDRRLGETRRLTRAVASRAGVEPPAEPPPIPDEGDRHERHEPAIPAWHERAGAPERRLHAPALAQLDDPAAQGRPVTFYNVNTRESLTLPLLAEDGRPRADALLALRTFIRFARTGEVAPVPIPGELVLLIARIAAQFGGRVEIVSGFRPPYRVDAGSYHGRGLAIDLRVPGRGPHEVYLFARSIGARGAGWYPRSGFVHLDVRDEPYYWIDRSRPDEPSREQREM